MTSKMVKVSAVSLTALTLLGCTNQSENKATKIDEAKAETSKQSADGKTPKSSSSTDTTKSSNRVESNRKPDTSQATVRNLSKTISELVAREQAARPVETPTTSSSAPTTTSASASTSETTSSTPTASAQPSAISSILDDFSAASKRQPTVSTQASSSSKSDTKSDTTSDDVKNQGWQAAVKPTETKDDDVSSSNSLSNKGTLNLASGRPYATPTVNNKDNTPEETPTPQPATQPTIEVVEAPVTIVDVPIASPAETPATAPVEAPATTPVETPVETPTTTPVETPVETPAATPVTTPTTPVEVIDVTSPTTPVETPVTPVEVIDVTSPTTPTVVEVVDLTKDKEPTTKDTLDQLIDTIGNEDLLTSLDKAIEDEQNKIASGEGSTVIDASEDKPKTLLDYLLDLQARIVESLSNLDKLSLVNDGLSSGMTKEEAMEILDSIETPSTKSLKDMLSQPAAAPVATGEVTVAFDGNVVTPIGTSN